MPLQLFRRAAGARRPKPHDICRRLAEDLCQLATQDGDAQPAAVAEAPPTACPHSADHREQLQRTVSEDIQKQLHVVLEILEEVLEQADRACHNGADHQHETADDLLNQFFVGDLPTVLVSHLTELEFEVRKDVISIFSVIVRLGSQPWADQKIREYARRQPKLFELLIKGYAKAEVATQCGIMLRSCARQQHLVEAFLADPGVVLHLMSFARHESFDISSDAFSSLHDFLLTHKMVSSVFLEKNFRQFFPQYNNLLVSDVYVTQRQALKLLSEILLDRTFMRVMLAYIGDENFLQIHMNLLRADSKAIQFEAFHVFKIFVANPQKPPRVQQILHKNKDKLVKLLGALCPNRLDDKQFDKDKTTVIGKLRVLEPPPRAGGHGAAPPDPGDSQSRADASRGQPAEPPAPSAAPAAGTATDTAADERCVDGTDQG